MTISNIKYIEKKTKKKGEYHYCDSILSSNKKIKTVKNVDTLVEMTTYKHNKMEVLYNDVMLKPYLDYDYKKKEKYDVNELIDHLTKCKDGISDFFRQFVTDWEFERDVAIASRHGRVPTGEYKISYRFYVINGMYTTLQTMDKLVKTKVELNIFDASVYNNNRKMAMLYGHKSREDRRTLLPIEKLKWKHTDFIIQYVPREYKYELSCDIPDVNVINKEKKVYCSELLNIKALEMPTDIRYDIDRNDIRGLLSIIPNDKFEYIDTNTWITICYSLCEAKSMGHTHLSYDELKELFLEFSKRYPSCNIQKDSDVFDSCVNNTKYNIGIDYLHGLIKKIYPNYWNTYYEKEIKSSKGIDYNEVYNEDTMRSYNMSNDIIVVKANPGTGKTVQLKKEIEKYPKDCRICVVSYNVVLCNKYHEMFNDGFKLYNEESNCDVDRIIICLDSLYRINDCEYDVLIIDEALSVLSHFDSSVMKRSQMVMNTLTSLMINSEKIIFLDANADEKLVTDTVKWIEKKKKTKAYYINNEYVRPTNRKFILMEERDVNKQISFVIEKLMLKKKIVVPVSSKDIAEKLELAVSTCISNLKIKKYDSESSRMELYLDSKNPNEAWKDLDLLIYTPTIGAGVSFEEEHFDICVGIFESSMNHASVYTCYQQLFRVRRLKDGEMFVFLNVYNYSNLSIEEKRVEYMMNTELNKMRKYCLNMDMRELNIETGKICYDKKKLSFPIIRNIILMKNRSLMYFESIFEKLMSDNNIPVIKNTYLELNKMDDVEEIIKTDGHNLVRDEFVEKFQNEKENLVLSVKEMDKIDKAIKNGGMDIPKDKIIKRNITNNLNKWGSVIDDISEEFYKSCILSVTNANQRGIDKKIIQSQRYKILNDELKYDYDRIKKQYVGDDGDDPNFKIYKNLKKTGHQQTLVTKKLLINVFDAEDGKISDIFDKKYDNKEWKDKLQTYIESFTADHWKYMLSLFGLDVVKRKKGRGDINYKCRSKFKDKNSNLGYNLVNTMMKETFGITLKAEDKRYTIFDESFWNEIKDNNVTYLNRTYKMREIEE
uniref:Replication origin-binding protein domain-containing protein n=1 Tax=Pyramimonas orientalis virus TaxID=455367 RepID=A0A7M3UPD5_POV01|nr:hypothetical protein HWQ62_00487 [Pyramimonas orientalis virus]